MFSKDKQRIVSFKGYLYVIFALLIWLQKAQKKKRERVQEISKDFAQYWSTVPNSVCAHTHIALLVLAYQYNSTGWRLSYHWVVWEKTTHPGHPSQLKVEDSWQLGKQCYPTSLAPNHCFCQPLQQTQLGFHLLGRGKKSKEEHQISHPPCFLPLAFVGALSEYTALLPAVSFVDSAT